jgi:hypothetical protein
MIEMLLQASNVSSVDIFLDILSDILHSTTSIFFMSTPFAMSFKASVASL